MIDPNHPPGKLDPAGFLDLIHGPDSRIYFQVGGTTWKNKPQAFRQAEKTLRWRNVEGDDIGFIVNGGGTRDAQITRFNAFFLDWDCGKNDAGRYLPDDQVRQHKEEYRERLSRFTLTPSILVETRNGFHVYWLAEPNVNRDQFLEIQKRLVKALDGDPHVVNPARVLRLPGFDWVKAGRGCARFQVRVVDCQKHRYTAEEMLRVLPMVPERDLPPVRICAHNKCECNTSLALIVGAYPATGSTSFPTIADAIDHLKRQDLGVLLGLTTVTAKNGQAILCPFHDDHRPSAGVFRAGSGHWLFKCHVCPISGTIIDLTMHIRKCNESAAIGHLLHDYGITIDTGWKDLQRAILERNLLLLNDAQALKGSYPALHRLIGRVLGDLISKHFLAQRFIVSERSQSDGQVVFFASLRHFHKVAAGKDHQPRYFNRQNEKVDRYGMLGLMHKLPDNRVPPHLLEQARRRQVASKHARRIQFYSIPEYTDAVLRTADLRARRLIDRGASVRGVSWEMIESVFGRALAEEVYPQRMGERSTTFCAKVQQVVRCAVEANGYTTTHEIRSAMRR
ncbi:MAG: CHC2 zinc finger domain-containing protein, partial [Bryobacteraceae bacterium]|nr:CHC2 zinc finger domain-containing protein [Bryobacteraceae bacterium]